MPARDWQQLYKKYRGQWVALADDQLTVIAHGSTISVVAREAREQGYDTPHLAKMPQDLKIFVGAVGEV